MPMLTMNPRDRCLLCGCRLRGFRVGTYRINKGSLVSTHGGALSWVECPECGPAFAQRNPTGVQQWSDGWRLDAKSKAVVDAHFARKGWAA